MIFYLISIFTFLYILKLLFTSNNEGKNLPPGPPSLPIIGSILHLIPYYKKQEAFGPDMIKKYGPLFGFQFGLQYYLYTENLDVAKTVLNSEQWIDRTNNHPMFFERTFQKPYGLLIGSGSAWREVRRFTIKSLREYGFGKNTEMEPSIEYELQELMAKIESMKEPENDGKIIVNMRKFFQIASLNILWKMLVGMRLSYEEPRLKKLLFLVGKLYETFKINLNPLIAFPFLRFIPGLTDFQLVTKRISSISDVFADITKQRRSDNSYQNQAKDVIDLFLQEIDKQKDKDSFFTDEQLIITGVDLFLTGLDSTSNTLEFSILFMILYPDIQRKVQAEIEEFIGKERIPDLSDKPKMPFTEAVTLEILRSAKNLPFTQRCANEDTEINGYTIPKGTYLGVNLARIHDSEELWDKPKEFNPDRFLDKDMNVINADKIIPFGFGKRVCIAENMARAVIFKFLTTLLQKYNVECSPNHPKPTSESISGFNTFPLPYTACFVPRYNN